MRIEDLQDPRDRAFCTQQDRGESVHVFRRAQKVNRKAIIEKPPVTPSGGMNPFHGHDEARPEELTSLQQRRIKYDGDNDHEFQTGVRHRKPYFANPNVFHGNWTGA